MWDHQHPYLAAVTVVEAMNLRKPGSAIITAALVAAVLSITTMVLFQKPWEPEGATRSEWGKSEADLEQVSIGNSDSEQGVSDQRADSEIERAQEESVRKESRPPRESEALVDQSINGGTRSFATSTAATDVLDKINQAEAVGDERTAEILEAQLRNFCGMAEIYSSNSESVQGQGIIELEQYCEGYEPQYDSALNDSSEARILESLYSETAERLSDRLNENLQTGDIDQELLELIASAKSPLELDAIYAAIEQYRAIGGEDLAAVLGSRSLLTGRDSLYWGDALNIYSCLKFNHCGRGSPRFISECVFMRHECSRYSNVLDIIYDRLSPNEVSSVNRLLAAISALEAHRERN